jgi:hypothetical protein
VRWFSGLRCQEADAAFAPIKNIENNPMQSNKGLAAMDALPAKTFDTSGKSPALF